MGLWFYILIAKDILFFSESSKGNMLNIYTGFEKSVKRVFYSLTKGILCIMCLRSVNSYTIINEIVKNY